MTRTKIPTEKLRTGAAHFSQTGQFLHYPLIPISGVIEQRLAKRILAYATERIEALGLGQMLRTWTPLVGTLDGEKPAEDRYYYVDWTNPEKTAISIVGILLSDGKPFLDHGVEIESR